MASIFSYLPNISLEYTINDSICVNKTNIAARGNDRDPSRLLRMLILTFSEQKTKFR